MKLLHLIFVAVGLMATIPACAGPITLQGSTTLSSRLMIPYQHAIEELSGQKIVIIPNKSSLGLQALFEKSAQFAMISGPLAVEVRTLRDQFPDAPFEKLLVFEVARTRMAFAVHPDNPVRSVTRDQLRRILLGAIQNWNEIGGRDLPIRLVIVREGGGVQASVESAVLNGQKIVARDPILVQISSQVVKVVLQEPDALGLAQLGVIEKARAPEMKLDEPVEQTLNLVTLGEPTPEMRKIINAARQIASETLE
jgi:phosphate transport system substrate-binding protein